MNDSNTKREQANGANEANEASAGRDDASLGVAVLTCDICGASKSYRGRPFRSIGNLRQHQRKLHGDAGAITVPSGHSQLVGSREARADVGLRAHDARFCPNCGLNLEVINAALRLIQG